MCEELLSAGSSTLLATHFPQLAELAVMYPQVRLWRLQVSRAGARGRAGRWGEGEGEHQGLGVYSRAAK